MSEEKPSIETPDTKKSFSEKGEDGGAREKEIGGFEKRPEPTRFGDWEVNGRCSDF
ncbi:MAG: DUF1674 domain-containing protein [Alphaproteobacteria bacterium]